jgi:hypothetical protein
MILSRNIHVMLLFDSEDDISHQRLASRVSVACRQQSVELQYYGSEIDCTQAWNQLKQVCVSLNLQVVNA